MSSNFFGPSAGYCACYANCSNFFGPSAGCYACCASNSIFFGTCAGYAATSSKDSIYIGTGAGCADTVNNTAGGTSIAIGRLAGTGGYSDSVAIGRGVKNSSACEMNLGNVMKLCGIYSCDMRSPGFVSCATVDTGTSTVKGGNLVLTCISAPIPAVDGQIYFNGTNFYGYYSGGWHQLDN